jgi:Methyltransferase domain
MPAATDPLVEAVYEHRLAEHARRVLAAGTAPLAQRALDTCDRIEHQLRAEVTRIETALTDGGVATNGTESIVGRQNHTITFLVDGPTDAAEAAAALVPLGFVPWERWQLGALESFRRSADQSTTARTDDVTTVVRFRWRARRERSRIARALTPTSGDWSVVSLPRWAWWGYSIVRPARLVAERLGLRPKHHASLGPFLATPDSLLEPLFELIGLDADDVLVDLGAGDGRIAVAAAVGRGCRAVAVEHDADLVAAARERAAAAGVSDRVDVVNQDARTADLTDATVVVVFLPIDVVADIAESVMSRLRSGARVLVHEQSRLPATLTPDTTTLVVGDDAVTVAHVWRVP